MEALIKNRRSFVRRGIFVGAVIASIAAVTMALAMEPTKKRAIPTVRTVESEIVILYMGPDAGVTDAGPM